MRAPLTGEAAIIKKQEPHHGHHPELPIVREGESNSCETLI
jgi:hypothetical protein